MSISKDTALSILSAHEKIERCDDYLSLVEQGGWTTCINLYNKDKNGAIEINNDIAIEALNHALVAARAELDTACQKAIEELTPF
ncbi:hypothetical protein FACS189479_05540 [Spirochaetia bacterium]|nr:hypothetical protein FACS189479_05540 [Spirochaetia bacterium]